MVGAVDEGGFHPDHRESGEHPLFGTFPQPLFHCREVVARHGAAEHRLLKHQVITITGLEFHPDVTELAVSARLLLMPALHLDLFRMVSR